MKKLILIRHAKSSWQSTATSDFDRPLNDRGKEDAPRMGEYLASLDLKPDQFYASSAVRAAYTARLIAKAMDFDPEAIVADRRLYLADVAHMQSIMREFSDNWECVFLMGHNPTLTDCANALANDELENIPTCGIYGIELNIDSWRKLRNGVGKRLFFQAPKLL